MNRRSGKTPQQAGRLAEVKAAKKIGARLHVASGALSQKADMTKGDFVIEAKATQAQTLKVEYSWLTKVSKEAVSVNKSPALLMQFVDLNGKAKRNGDWIAIPASLFNELLESNDG